MRALFDYEPEEDTLLPCKEIGLPFQYGDILQVSFFIAEFFFMIKEIKFQWKSNVHPFFLHIFFNFRW